MNHSERIKAVEQILNYRFLNRQYLIEALVHKSYATQFQLGFNYERLEFLGDSLLQMFVTELLYRDRQTDQGQLTRLRAHMVSRITLAGLVRDMDLEPYVLVQQNLRDDKGFISGDFLGDFFESLLAALYLDGGVEASSTFLSSKFSNISIFEDYIDYKSRLQEFSLKATKQLPVYDTILDVEGYLAVVRVSGSLEVSGKGSSKKKAEQMAAKQALEVLVAASE
ncbi:MAG: ribonuclease III [bacterium]|nr:ribonuclease III [bacterium]